MEMNIFGMYYHGVQLVNFAAGVVFDDLDGPGTAPSSISILLTENHNYSFIFNSNNSN